MDLLTASALADSKVPVQAGQLRLFSAVAKLFPAAVCGV